MLIQLTGLLLGIMYAFAIVGMGLVRCAIFFSSSDCTNDVLSVRIGIRVPLVDSDFCYRMQWAGRLDVDDPRLAGTAWDTSGYAEVLGALATATLGERVGAFRLQGIHARVAAAVSPVAIHCLLPCQALTTSLRQWRPCSIFWSCTLRGCEFKLCEGVSWMVVEMQLSALLPFHPRLYSCTSAPLFRLPWEQQQLANHDGRGDCRLVTGGGLLHDSVLRSGRASGDEPCHLHIP